MGYNNRGAVRVIFDLETVALPQAADYLDPPKPPANYKDPAKIAAYVEEKAVEQLEGCSLDPDLCRIVALGWKEEDENGYPAVLRCRDDDEEADAIRMFWDALDERATIGYSSLGFDLPILLRRSLYLGVPAPALVIDKYRSPHIDLQQRLSHNGLLKFRGLSWYCRRFGLTVPGEDTASGKDIAGFVAAGEWEKVLAHCRADVLRTKALAERMGLLKQQPAMSEAAF